MRRAQNHGFSLIELSIVLTVLGLLVGGIMAGRSIIKSAELRSVWEEYQQIESATLMFKETYQQMPGDMSNATEFWSGTWNGDGFGTLNYPSGANQNGEIFTYWQHLALANLLPGQYTGRAGSGSSEDSEAGVNVMRARYPAGGWSVSTIRNGVTDPSWASGGWYTREYGHILQIGRKIANYEYGGYLFTPAEAFLIDSKVDDGVPATGKLVGRFWNNLCGTAVSGATTSTNLNTQYRLSETQPRCSLTFIPAFNYR